MGYVGWNSPEPGWQEELDRVVPRTERGAWLKLVWDPGMPYEPVSRWVIYEMQGDLSRVNPRLLAEFFRPPPRQDGLWVPDTSVLGRRRWHSHSTISQMQYDLFHAHRAYPSKLWIVQGHGGGHKWALSTAEDRLFRFRCEGQEWPAPGELPYANPDRRTFEMLAALDRFRQADRRLLIEEANYYMSPVLDLNGGHEPNERLESQQTRLNEAIAGWLEMQFENLWDVMPRSAKQAVKDAAAESPYEQEPDYESIEREFVHS